MPCQLTAAKLSAVKLSWLSTPTQHFDGGVKFRSMSGVSKARQIMFDHVDKIADFGKRCWVRNWVTTPSSVLTVRVKVTGVVLLQHRKRAQIDVIANAQLFSKIC